MEERWKDFFQLMAIAILISGCYNGAPVQGDGLQCQLTRWNLSKPECSGEFDWEVYTEVNGRDDKTRKYCCSAGKENYGEIKRKATGCRTTACTSSESANICSTFYDRYVEGVKLEYEEILKETCLKKSKEPGRIALCCLRNSSEGMLATQMGAEENEFPHMAKFFTPNHCGGTVYNKRFIISAAHCIVDKNTRKLKSVKEMKVILGTNLGDINFEENVYFVKRAIPHPEYSRLLKDERLNKLIFNDVALLELDRDIQFGKKVMALEIAPEGFKPIDYASEAVIIGWGTTYTLDTSKHLLKANMIIREDESCFEKYGRRNVPFSSLNRWKDQLLCMGGIMDGKWSASSGEGDSGGGVLCRGPDGRAVLCGITSFGGTNDEACVKYQDAKNCPPGVFADVGYFHKWIVNQAGPQDESTLYKPFLYGQLVSKDTFPPHVFIQDAKGRNCSGTLIAANIVVTAANCIVSGSKKRREKIRIITNTGRTFKLKGVAILPDFEEVENPFNGTNLWNKGIMLDKYYYINNIAILKLKENVSISQEELPQLPDFDDEIEYGTEVTQATQRDKLMLREFRIIDYDECQARMNRMHRIGIDIRLERNVLCGVEIYSGGSQCDRELGGGLICTGKTGKDVLCGVQVFRLCKRAIPNGFFDVKTYRNWIRKAIDKLS